MSPFDRREQADEAKRSFAVNGSDHLTSFAAYEQWKKTKELGAGIARNFLSDNFLSFTTLSNVDQMKRQFKDLLRDIGFLPPHRRGGGGGGGGDSSAEENSGNLALVTAVLCAGLYPNVVVAPRSLGGKSLGEVSLHCPKGDVHVHPCSVAFKADSLTSRYAVYHDMVKTTKIYVRDVTPSRR